MPVVPTTSSVPNPRQSGYDAVLGTLPLRLAVTPQHQLAIETADTQTPPVETGATAEEYIDTFGKVWARSDFTGGEGLYTAYRRGMTPLDLTRYWASSNVDIRPPVNGTPPSVRLSVLTERVDTLTNTILRMAWTGTDLYVTTGSDDDLRVSANPTAATPTFADEDPHDGEAATNVTGVVNDGTTVYAAAQANGIHWDNGAGWEHYSNITASNMWLLGDRLLASDNTSATSNPLYEIPIRGTPPVAATQTLKTLGPSVGWWDACEAGSHILAAGGDGKIYAFAPDASAVLELTAQTPVGDGEIPTAMAAQGQLVFVQTRQTTPASGAIARFYRCDLLESGVLDNWQLIRQWGDETSTIHHEARRMLATRDAVYVFARDTSTQVTVWRYDLATAGLSAAHTFAAAGTTSVACVTGAVMVNGVLYVGIDGSGVWRTKVSTSAKYNTGWLIAPLIDFYTAADKAWAAVRLDGTVGDAASEPVILVYYTVDPAGLHDIAHASWQLLATIDSTDIASGTAATFNQDIPLPSVNSRYLAVAVKLLSKGAPSAGTDGPDTPTLRSLSVRGFVKSSDVVVTLPVAVSDQIERRNKHAGRVRGQGDAILNELLGLVGEAVSLQVYRPTNKTFYGTVEKVAAPVVALGERGSPTSVCYVQFRGRETS